MTEERWNGGTEERWNGGTVERWHGGAVERWNDWARLSTDDQSQVIPMFDSRTFADIRVIRVPAIANQIRRGQREPFEARIAANGREFARMSANDKRKWEGLILGVFACSRAF